MHAALCDLRFSFQFSCSRLQMPETEKAHSHNFKRQRISLMGGEEPWFKAPRASPLFPAVNPILAADEAMLSSPQDIVRAYVDSLEVCFLFFFPLSGFYLFSVL